MKLPCRPEPPFNACWLRRVSPLIVTAILISACTAGPDFSAPRGPSVNTYFRQAWYSRLTAGSGEPAQRLVQGKEIPARWWTVFHSSVLDMVVREAVSGNPSIDVARDRLTEARQLVIESRSGYYPQIDLTASATRQRGPAFALALLPSTQRNLPTFNLYSLGSDVSFSPDVFGATRRDVERQTALAEVRNYQLAAAELIITGDAVTEVLNIASLRRQITVTRSIIKDDRENLALIRARFRAGKIARDDVFAAETQLAGDQAALPVLKQQQVLASDTLAVLVGKAPAEWKAPPFALGEFVLPSELPVSLPSALVRQRPDILAAQAKLHASSAAIGVATAHMYPVFALSGSLDTAALAATSLFEQPSVIWTLAGGLTAPIFHAGALRAGRKRAVAGFKASLATYRQTVLGAFGQVANILRALRHDAELVAADRRTLNAAKAALELRRLRYAVGEADLLPLLDAQRGLRKAQLAYTRAKVRRYLDSAQLFVAMGGGWWNGTAEHPSQKRDT